MKNVGVLLAAVSVVLVTVFGISRCERVKEEKMLSHIENIDDLKNIFSSTPEQIAQLTDKYIEQTKEAINKIIAVPDDKRTFENTAFALDRLGRVSNLELFGASCAVLKEVSPDEAIRNASREALMKLSAFEVDWIGGNVELYKAFKAYAQGNAKNEKLREDQRYFIDETMKDFKRSGLELPTEQLEMVKKLQKELVDLSMKFSTNVASSNPTVEVDRADLAGLDDDFINSLKRTEDGKYVLQANMPTYQLVVEDCKVAQTRKKIFHAYWNRAYPINNKILEGVIAKRDELARLLGFKSYAHLNLDSKMLKSPEHVQQFLQNLLEKLNKKEQVEFELLVKDLPESVSLTSDGKIQQWDMRFTQNEYKKKHFDIDEAKLSEYFQLEHTLESMFSLYETFFGVRFEAVESNGGFWHPEVRLVKVIDASTNQLLSYLLLDLYPRANKYGHAAHFGVLTGIKTEKNGWPAVGFVVANFPKSTATKPSLLKLESVRTLFHEFGHAMHHILGRTRLASFGGTAVKRDFVEVPSQMLEEWLWDQEVLKMVSKHYQTGQSLSDEIIKKIQAFKKFDRGWFWQRQSLFALLSLAYFKEGAQKDLEKVWRQLEKTILRNTAPDPDNHHYASFGHLLGYGACYYSYIWSRVLSQDVFEHIDKDGLLRLDAGKRYVELVLNPGGSKDPNVLMRKFLGREPNDKAFCRTMGLN
ncbi:M3 family metallopeptidase [Candidatus Dependentiae bacterium]